MLVASVLALAPPKITKSVKLSETNTEGVFTTSVDAQGGFIVPEDIEQGVYSVFVDENGVAHHTKLNGTSSAPLIDSIKQDETATNKVAKRQLGEYGPPNIKCSSQDLDHGWCDEAVADLRGQCGNWLGVKGDHHIYAVRGNIAAFFCNRDGPEWATAGRLADCTSNWIGDYLAKITNYCGWYRGGWTEPHDDWGVPPVSIGYHHVGADKVFCGWGHY